jgi:tetratricopeptide (TPR) repeat protein
MNAFGAADTAIADTQAQQTPSPAPPQHNWLPVTNQTDRTNEPLAAQAVLTVREAAPPKRRTGLVIGLGLLAVGVAVTTIVVLGRRGDTEKVVVEQPLAPAAPAPSAPPSAAPSEKDKLTRHLKAAREAEAKNKLDDALAAYQAAYTIDPSVETTYALAELHQQLGHTADAIRYFERYLMNAAKDAPNRDSVAKRIAQLDGSTKPAGTVARHPSTHAGGNHRASNAGAQGTGSGSAKELRECHCLPKDRRNTVSMCAVKGPSMCRCAASTGGSLCPMQVTQCPDTCPDGTDGCKKFCSSSGFECADRTYNKQRKPGVHGTVCNGFEDWRIDNSIAGKLDCDHCDVVPNPRQFRGRDGEACVGYFRETGEKLDGILSCY